MYAVGSTLTPFLYPAFFSSHHALSAAVYPVLRTKSRLTRSLTSQTLSTESHSATPNPPFNAHLNPPPDDYGRTIFADKCTLQVRAGSGGHGCISFLREKFIAEGPPNGGDGGTGGNVYIQAVRGETSLHKLARRGILRATRGQNGQGKSKGGSKGEDVLIQVPVGTVVREVSRHDPVGEEAFDNSFSDGLIEPSEEQVRGQFRRDKWILYPSAAPSAFIDTDFPTLPRNRKSSLATLQPPAPIFLDLAEHMDKPILLAAGAVGGYGNPHFVTRDMPRPKFATKGEIGMLLNLELELKLLADVGFVGLPNAGKSTLLRALSRSRARVGDWAFTTLQPNIGTIVLDNAEGRPRYHAIGPNGELKTQLSVADVPGLVPDAHLDRGMGLGFLRHIERARVLAFVIDLSAGSPVDALKALWRELKEYEKIKDYEMNTRSETRKNLVEWKPFGSHESAARPEDGAVEGLEQGNMMGAPSAPLPMLEMPPISTKPWFVVATKADLPDTQGRFEELKLYLTMVSGRLVAHPSGRKNGWRGSLEAIPISAIRGEGVDRIPDWTISLLHET